jgi:tRNA pseudouridine55 synthase
LATGLLVLGIGQATKLLTFIVGADKTYETTIRLGASTISDDSESDFVNFANPEKIAQITAAQIDLEISKLRGKIAQVPSAVSAIKVDGKRAYAMVRAGEQVELKAREVIISRFDRVSEPRLVEHAGHKFIDFDAVIDCSSGTYVRALARDLGELLGSGAHLTALRRTRIGKYRIDSAQTMDSAEPLKILPLAEAAAAIFPTVTLAAEEQRDILHGKRIGAPSDCPDLVAGITERQNLLAILEKKGRELKSVVVFPEDQND